MIRRHCYLLLLLVIYPMFSQAQQKAYVLQNAWNNELNNYTPKEFFDKLFGVLKRKLVINDLVAEPKSLTGNRKDEERDKNIKEQIKIKKEAGENAFFITMVSELRLPAFNLGKFLFKNPPRSSKFTFTIRVFDTSGNEVMGDTINNRGCLVQTINEEKGSRFFYSDYSNFMSDMQCHLEYIDKVLQQKTVARKEPAKETK